MIARVIIGAIGSDSLDRDHYRRGYHGRVQCYAQNRLGRIYKAAGARPYNVQQLALNKCYNRSYECRPIRSTKAGAAAKPTSRSMQSNSTAKPVARSSRSR